MADKFNIYNVAFFLVVIIIFAVIFIRNDEGKKELYQRSELGQRNICTFGRTPVDYYMNPTENPHYLGNPGSKFQPLYQGVDLYSEERRKFGQSGSLYPKVFLPSDTKTQYDLTAIGDYDVARQLDSFPESMTHNFAHQLNLKGAVVDWD
jgi:hypothetical protein